MTERELSRNERFSELFQAMVSAMTKIDRVSIPDIENTLIELSLLFRLSKAVTRAYRNPQEELEGKGETLKCFDLYREDEVEVAHVRVVTSVMTIVDTKAYMEPQEKPLDEDERDKIELVMRTVASFVSRNRLRDIVAELAMFDDMGYPNVRSLQKYVGMHTHPGMLENKAALNYNLRHFSLVNQEIGRAAADKVMRAHFEGLKKLIGERDCAFRLGGDNFVAFCGTDRLEDVLSYLNEARVIYDQDEPPVNIPSSTGVFIVPDGFVLHDMAGIMEKIIPAMRAAQNGGRGHTVIYDETLMHIKEKSMRVQQLFPQALRDEEFTVYYQPKVNIITGELCGAEALCRWIRDGKVVPPMDFIPMLEETNDICKLDLYMLDRVCKDLRRWMDEERKIVRISVNLSRKHMMNSDLLNTIKGIVDRYDIPHKYIEIELTETTTDVEFSDLKRVVSGLQHEGIYTSVDDFGIGYSSLNLIRAIPWNVLKVDRSFLPVEGDKQESSRSIMFKYVVAMAKEMGLECIAEGVETQSQLEVLKEHNCTLAQGFFFDRPLPVEQFEDRLEIHSYPLGGSRQK